MSLLKKENWWIWLLLLLSSSGCSVVALAAILDLFDRDAWYAKWYYWIIGLALFIFPFCIMLYVFYIQMTCKVAAKLNIKGSEYYLSPYIWLICIIIPFLGWLGFIFLFIYLNIVILIKLYKGEGEIYIK